MKRTPIEGLIAAAGFFAAAALILVRRFYGWLESLDLVVPLSLWVIAVVTPVNARRRRAPRSCSLRRHRRRAAGTSPVRHNRRRITSVSRAHPRHSSPHRVDGSGVDWHWPGWPSSPWWAS